jgi:hypothetical protein
VVDLADSHLHARPHRRRGHVPVLVSGTEDSDACGIAPRVLKVRCESAGTDEESRAVSDNKPTQFDLERYAYHDEIMQALDQRYVWARGQLIRRFRVAMGLAILAGLYRLLWSLAGWPGGVLAMLVPSVLLLVVSATLMIRNSPTRWNRRWNADHPQMGQYLAHDLTD